MGSLAQQHDCLLLDLDGTLFRGHAPTEGAVAALEATDTRALFVTNNASRAADDVAAHLRELGFTAEAADVVTSAQSAAKLLADHLPAGSAVLVVGSLSAPTVASVGSAGTAVTSGRSPASSSSPPRPPTTTTAPIRSATAATPAPTIRLRLLPRPVPDAADTSATAVDGGDGGAAAGAGTPGLLRLVSAARLAARTEGDSVPRRPSPDGLPRGARHGLAWRTTFTCSPPHMRSLRRRWASNPTAQRST